jgi:N utilization substance protein B
MAKQLTEKQVQIAQRQKARHYAVQALYQRELSQADLNKIEAEFIADNDFSKVDADYFHELLHKIPAELDVLDAAIEPALTDRKMTDIGPVEISLLRMGSYELKNRIDIPYKVVINEAVQLAKKFGPVESHKFVNAILDKVAEQFRQIELQAAGR